MVQKKLINSEKLDDQKRVVVIKRAAVLILQILPLFFSPLIPRVKILAKLIIFAHYRLNLIEG